MGTILSSNRDFNHALATQPRKSFGISKFEVPDNLNQHPLIGTLTIPVPVRYSQPAVIFNQPSELDQTLVQPTIAPIISEKQPPVRSSSVSPQPNLPTLKNQTMSKDASIIYRSVTNLNHHRRTNNHQLSSFGPSRSIVERNGKQFITEMKERMERRHVQVFDETTGQIRLFEVTDYIPSRIVRSTRIHPQNNTSSFNNRSILPAITYNPTEPTKSSTNLVDFNGLSNRDTVAREFDLYHRGGPLPLNNNSNVSRSQSAGQNANDSNYSHAQSKPYNNSTATSQEVPSHYTAESRSYQPSSFRHHSPTASDYSASESTVQSTTSDDESGSDDIDQTMPSNTRRTDVSYGTLAGQNTSVQLDPFKKIINQRDPYYKKRHGSHNYSEPISKTRGFQTGVTSDYAPIPLSHRLSNSNQYSHRQEYSGYNS